MAAIHHGENRQCTECDTIQSDDDKRRNGLHINVSVSADTRGFVSPQLLQQ